MLNRAQLQHYVEISFQKDVIQQNSTETQTAGRISDDHDHYGIQNTRKLLVHFVVRVTAFQSNHEITCNQLKRFCQSLYSDQTLFVENTSMSKLGEKLLEALVDQYPKREWEIRVRESGEDGAFLWYFDVS